MFIFDLPQYLDTVHFRHNDIENHQIKVFSRRDLKAFRAIPCSYHIIALTWSNPLKLFLILSSAISSARLHSSICQIIG
jgi:hypothetical protein